MDVVTTSSKSHKELIFVTLIEHICKLYQSSSFNDICSEFQSRNILNDPLLYSDQYSQRRDIIESMLLRLINPSKTTTISIEEKIGDGAFGAVYRMYNTLDQKYYALKRIPMHNKNISEVRLLASLDHPNISRYYNTWIDTNYHSDNGKDLVIASNIEPILNIQMEMYAFTLRYYLHKRPNVIANIDTKIIKGLLDGLEHIHEHNILHRDLHPDNIFIDDQMIPKIGDFGMSIKFTDIQNIDDHYYGVDLYMAPEYINENIFDASSDIYSLGIMFFELYNHFKTDMERCICISQARDNKYKGDKIYDKIIRRIIRRKSWRRPDIHRIKELFTKYNRKNEVYDTLPD